MNNKEPLLCLGKMFETSIGWDYFDPIRVRFTVTIDHEVDEDLIKKAWDRTKRVYPLIDAVPSYEHDFSVYLDPKTRGQYMNDKVFLVPDITGVNDPVKSKVPVSPGTEIVGGRLVCVTYYKDRITICTYHSLMDAGGVLNVFRTFLYSYFALYTGVEDEQPVVELREGRSVSDYYTVDIRDVIYAAAYTPQPIYSLPLNTRGFMDADMVNDEHVYGGNLHLSVSDFMKVCKENGLNPSALLCAAAAKAAYTVHPEEQRNLVLSLTVSLKKYFGRNDDISNALGLAHTYATPEDIKNLPVVELAKRMRGELGSQLTADYSSSFYRFVDNYQVYHSMPKFNGRVITYVGGVNIGKANDHILDIRMETNSSNVVNMTQINDIFSLMVLYGQATGKYLDVFSSFFSGMGIKTEVHEPVHHLQKGTDHAVL
ncbi:MAG: hypothetical protein K5744_07795 [Eubacterium sp.]|nr:hypothetical protein [Eubacterium sp.]